MLDLDEVRTNIARSVAAGLLTVAQAEALADQATLLVWQQEYWQVHRFECQPL